VPVPDRAAVNVQAFGGTAFGGTANMDLSALSAMNLGNFGGAASFAELGQLANQFRAGALTREEFDAEVRKLFGR
jgi:hypothetical protein